MDRLLHLNGLNKGGTDTTIEVEDGEDDDDDDDDVAVVVVLGGPDGGDTFVPQLQQEVLVVVSTPAPPTQSESVIDVGDATPDEDPPVMAHTNPQS